MENKNSDNPNRLSSRSASHFDAIDCIVNTNDLIIENEVLTKQNERPRESSNSRRERTAKHSNDGSINRSNRHSPITVTRKRHTSPRSTSSSRVRHHYHSSQKSHRVSSPSPSPPPPPPPALSSSHRHHRLAPSSKRPHSKSRSPYERRPPTYRSRPETTKDRSTTDEKKTSKSMSSNQETADLSFVSEDELTKPHDIQSNGTTVNESATSTINTKTHSTPSLPTLQPNINESLLDMSSVTQEGELSLFAASTLSNNNSIVTPSTLQRNNLMETIELISKYKAMQVLPCNDPQVEACSKEIFKLIQKQIELQRIELNCREREIRLHDRKLAEREKRFNEKSSDTPSTTSVKNEPSVTIKSTINEEKPQQKIDIVKDQDMKDVSEEESSGKSIPLIAEASKVDASNKNTTDQPSVMRKKTGKSRFSPSDIDPSMFTPQENSTIDRYSEEHDANFVKKPTISKILAPTDSMMSIVDTELKVTSSNSCRKVEIQSSNTDKPSTSKGPSHDLRYTLSKNRSKNHNNHEDNSTNGNQPIHDDEPTITISKTISSKIQTTKEDKQQSHDYHQRSVTSTSIEAIIDDSTDKRDTRRHQQPRINNSRQQQYSGQISTNSTKDRAYIQDSTSQQAPKYGLNQKRHETDDLRARLYDQHHPKSSRTTYRNNH